MVRRIKLFQHHCLERVRVPVHRTTELQRPVVKLQGPCAAPQGNLDQQGCAGDSVIGVMKRSSACRSAIVASENLAAGGPDRAVVVGATQMGGVRARHRSQHGISDRLASPQPAPLRSSWPKASVVLCLIQRIFCPLPGTWPEIDFDSG